MKRPAKTPKPLKPVRAHPFADSGHTTAGLKPQRICGTCFMPESDRRHDLPDTTPEAQQADAARLGEKGPL